MGSYAALASKTQMVKGGPAPESTEHRSAACSNMAGTGMDGQLVPVDAGAGAVAALPAGQQPAKSPRNPASRNLSPRAQSSKSGRQTTILWPALTQSTRGQPAKRGASHSRSLHRLKLSALLSKAPSLFDDKKISVVEKYVTDVDLLPKRFWDIKTLYLSNNSLRSLAGLQQFRCLKTLSVANNLLDDFDALNVLAHTSPGLQAISLDGNPLARLPNYRAQIILRLPQIRSLDGKAVDAAERRAARSAIKHEEVLLALMLSNACLVHKLGRAVRLMQLHSELRHVLFSSRLPSVRTCLPLSVSMNATKLMQLWDYEGSLSGQERKAICMALRREVGRRQRQAAASASRSDPPARDKDWKALDNAFAQVLLAQQAAIVQLMGLFEDAKADAEAALLHMASADPHLRLHREHSQQAFNLQQAREDRESLIVELRSNVFALVDAFHGNSLDQAQRYQTRMRELQAQLQDCLAESGSSPRLLLEHSGAEWAAGPGSLPRPPRAATPGTAHSHPDRQARSAATGHHAVKQRMETGSSDMQRAGEQAGAAVSSPPQPAWEASGRGRSYYSAAFADDGMLGSGCYLGSQSTEQLIAVPGGHMDLSLRNWAEPSREEEAGAGSALARQHAPAEPAEGVHASPLDSIDEQPLSCGRCQPGRAAAPHSSTPAETSGSAQQEAAQHSSPSGRMASTEDGAGPGVHVSSAKARHAAPTTSSKQQQPHRNPARPLVSQHATTTSRHMDADSPREARSAGQGAASKTKRNSAAAVAALAKRSRQRISPAAERAPAASHVATAVGRIGGLRLQCTETVTPAASADRRHLCTSQGASMDEAQQSLGWSAVQDAVSRAQNDSQPSQRSGASRQQSLHVSCGRQASPSHNCIVQSVRASSLIPQDLDQQQTNSCQSRPELASESSQTCSQSSHASAADSCNLQPHHSDVAPAAHHHTSQHDSDRHDPDRHASDMTAGSINEASQQAMWAPNDAFLPFKPPATTCHQQPHWMPEAATGEGHEPATRQMPVSRPAIAMHPLSREEPGKRQFWEAGPVHLNSTGGAVQPEAAVQDHQQPVQSRAAPLDATSSTAQPSATAMQVELQGQLAMRRQPPPRQQTGHVAAHTAVHQSSPAANSHPPVLRGDSLHDHDSVAFSPGQGAASQQPIDGVLNSALPPEAFGPLAQASCTSSTATPQRVEARVDSSRPAASSVPSMGREQQQCSTSWSPAEDHQHTSLPSASGHRHLSSLEASNTHPPPTAAAAKPHDRHPCHQPGQAWQQLEASVHSACQPDQSTADTCSPLQPAQAPPQHQALPQAPCVPAQLSQQSQGHPAVIPHTYLLPARAAPADKAADLHQQSPPLPEVELQHTEAEGGGLLGAEDSEEELLQRLEDLKHAKAAAEAALKAERQEVERLKADALQAQQMKAELAAVKAALAAQELQASLQQRSEAVAGRSLQRWALVMWQQQAAQQKEWRAVNGTASRLRRRQHGRRWLARWHLAAVRSRTLTRLHCQRGSHCVAAAFTVWRAHTAACALVDAHASATGVSVVAFHGTSLLRRTWRAWHAYLHAAARPKAATRRQAGMHRQSMLCRAAFGSWRAAAVSRRRKQSLRHLAGRHRAVLTGRKALKQWQLAAQRQGQKRIAVLRAQRCWRRLRCRAVLRAWRFRVHILQAARHMQVTARASLLSSWFTEWRTSAAELQVAREEISLGSGVRMQLLLRRAVRAWALVLQRAQHKRLAASRAAVHAAAARRARAFAGWQMLWRQQREWERQQRLKLAGHTLHRWRRFVAIVQERHYAMWAAGRLHRHHMQRRLHHMLACWRGMVLASRARHGQAMAVHRRIAMYCRQRALRRWVAAHQAQRLAAEQEERALLAAQLAECKERLAQSQEQVARHACEISRLASQLHSCSGDLSAARTAAAAVPDLNSRIAQQQLQLQDAQQEIAQLRDAVAQREEDAAAAQLQAEEQRHQLQQSLREAQRELAGHCAVRDACQELLAEAVGRGLPETAALEAQLLGPVSLAAQLEALLGHQQSTIQRLQQAMAGKQTKASALQAELDAATASAAEAAQKHCEQLAGASQRHHAQLAEAQSEAQQAQQQQQDRIAQLQASLAQSEERQLARIQALEAQLKRAKQLLKVQHAQQKAAHLEGVQAGYEIRIRDLEARLQQAHQQSGTVGTGQAVPASALPAPHRCTEASIASPSGRVRVGSILQPLRQAGTCPAETAFPAEPQHASTRLLSSRQSPTREARYHTAGSAPDAWHVADPAAASARHRTAGKAPASGCPAPDGLSVDEADLEQLLQLVNGGRLTAQQAQHVLLLVVDGDKRPFASILEAVCGCEQAATPRQPCAPGPQRQDGGLDFRDLAEATQLHTDIKQLQARILH